TVLRTMARTVDGARNRIGTRTRVRRDVKPTNEEELYDYFEQHFDEYLKFEKVESKLCQRPDLHAFLLLDKLCPGTKDIVACADHEVFYLDIAVDDLLEQATEERISYPAFWPRGKLQWMTQGRTAKTSG